VTPFKAFVLCLAAVVPAVGGCAAPGTGNQIVASSIDETKLVTLSGNTHPKATAAYDIGPVDDGFVLEHMQLVLQRSPELQADLEAHIARLHDTSSAQYHQWLGADEFAATYGVSESDLGILSDWLVSHGFVIDGVPESRMFIEFTGTAKQVRETFHTQIDNLSVNGVAHIANMTDPAIPEALSPVVVGVHALHDFMPHPLFQSKGLALRDSGTGEWSHLSSDFTVADGSNTFYLVAPPDFATIYNLTPLFSAGIRGAGQTIAVIEDTKIEHAADVTTFRKAFGLSGYTGTFKQVSPSGSTTCSNPGVNADEPEAALDAEWAGAAAPDAAIELAACNDTTTVFGGLIAVQNLINSAKPPQIMSISYGECESENGASANASYVHAYEQAVAEGISVFVSAGDEGAASCDADEPVATQGISVSGFASTPYNVAVGGTDFADTYDTALGGPAVTRYWNATNSSTKASAKSYVPEIPWNDSCASKLIYTTEGYTAGYGEAGFCNSSNGANYQTTAAASGGPSAYSKQPAFQHDVIGLPTASGGPRYLPDVSLFAANGVWGHFYVYCLTDIANGGVSSCNYGNTNDVLDLGAGGTSFASPALAGIQALVNQKTGDKQGNPNVTYYKLAATEYGAHGDPACNSTRGTPTAPELPASSCIFRDVTLGDIDVNCTGKDCYGDAKSGTYQGVLSTSSSSLHPAYPAGTGWDYATGLGTVNAENLVNKW
jgi:subtilase family serine protease